MAPLARAAVAAVALLAVWAGPAAAHGRGADAGNFRSTITQAPHIEGLRWRVLHGDDLLWLRNESPRDVVVLGHQGEPYLRLGPDGTFENRHSPTVALHRERYATDRPPHAEHRDGAVAEREPDWRRVSARPEWSWHDHRIHWMSPNAPDVAGETVLIPRWEVPFVVGGRAHALVGELRWVPAPPAWPWLLVGLLLTLPALAGLRLKQARQDGSWPTGLRPAAAVLAAVALLDTVHLLDDLSAPGALEARLFTAAQTLLYLALALAGALRARRGDYAGLTALGIGSFALFLGQGLLYLPVLASSQLGTVLPDWLSRLSVAVNIVQLAPIGVVLWAGGRRIRPDAETQATSSN